MAQLDIAGRALNGGEHDQTCHFQCVSLQNSARVAETSLGLAAGDTFAGPVRAQAILLSKSEAAGEQGSRDGALAIDAALRELLRDDRFLDDTPAGGGRAAQNTGERLSEAVRAAAVAHSGDSGPPRVAIGVLRWPRVWVVESDSLHAVVFSNRLCRPLAGSGTREARTAELGDEDVLVIGSTLALAGAEDYAAQGRAAKRSAAEIADDLLTWGLSRTDQSNGAVVAVRFQSDPGPGEVAESLAGASAAGGETAAAYPPIF